MKHDNLPKISISEVKTATNIFDDITVKINGYEFRVETDWNNKFIEYGFIHSWKGYEIAKHKPGHRFCDWLKRRDKLGNYTWICDCSHDWQIKTKKIAQEILLHLWFTREEKTNEET